MLLATPGAAEEPPPDGRMQRILERQRLVVGVKADYPPWGMVAPDGRIVGLEADLARDLADRLGVALELVPVTAANRLRRLEQGAVDLVIATLGDTPERRRISDLVRPHYYASGVNLLARRGTPFREWGQLRGRPVCLTDGAFSNRTLIERYLVDPVVFAGTRDTLMALRDGRCVGWAFDDTVLARLLTEPDWAAYHLAMPSILETPWSIAVRRGEGDAALGRFVAEAVADWHRTGRLVALQRAWGLPDSPYLDGQRALWTATAEGAPVCAHAAGGSFRTACSGDPLDRTEPHAAETPAWAAALGRTAGLDLAPLFDRLDRARLLEGMRLTLAISLTSIAGALGVGVVLAWAEHDLPRNPAGRLARLPLIALVAVARMTPPILQLYLVFFGLGGLLASGYGVRLGSFLVAALVFSLYAGATNAVLIGAALRQLARERPAAPARRLLPAAVERCYEGLVATSVNIVKAAGLASTIALAESISAVNTIIAEGGDAATMMNLLLAFYLLFVLGVLGALRAGRGLVSRCAPSR